SAFVRGMYDFAFAEHRSPSPGATMAAGSMIRLMARMIFNYRGSMFYKMEGGMGDVVFAPFYTVLERRGVKFAFFHSVKKLGLSSDRRAVENIEIERQVRLKDGDGEYRPLCEVQGLPSW